MRWSTRRSLTASPTQFRTSGCSGCSTAAVRAYAAKSEDRAQELAPFGDRPVNATEAAVTAICAIMRAADLNFFDLQMWYRRAGNPMTGAPLMG